MQTMGLNVKSVSFGATVTEVKPKEALRPGSYYSVTEGGKRLLKRSG